MVQFSRVLGVVPAARVRTADLWNGLLSCQRVGDVACHMAMGLCAVHRVVAAVGSDHHGGLELVERSKVHANVYPRATMRFSWPVLREATEFLAAAALV